MIDLEFPKSVEDFIDWYVSNLDEQPTELNSYQRNVYAVISMANQHSAVFGCDVNVIKPRKGMGFRWKCARGDECPSVDPSFLAKLRANEAGITQSETPTPVHHQDESSTDLQPESS